MKRTMILFAAVLMMMATATSASATITENEIDTLELAQTWYADRVEGIINRFEGLRHHTGELLQTYTIFPYAQATYPYHALVASTWDHRMMVMFTPDGNDIVGKVVTKQDLPKDIYFSSFTDLLQSATSSNDITLSQRPLPVRECDKKNNRFYAVVETQDKVNDAHRYTEMMFKPHRNAVKLVDENHEVSKDEEGNVLHDDMAYTFKLNNPSVMPKMFRGYENEEMVPWVVKPEFFETHNLLQYSRWKEGEPKRKASNDVCRIVSDYYGGRPIKDTQWIASVPTAERSFYAVQFENQGGDALGAMVCVAEGMVASVWEFHGSSEPQEYQSDQSVWFVDDEGDFIAHAPEIHCITTTNEGLELYVRLFGGESVQYYILREVGEIWMTLQVDYYIYVW